MHESERRMKDIVRAELKVHDSQATLAELALARHITLPHVDGCLRMIRSKPPTLHAPVVFGDVSYGSHFFSFQPSLKMAYARARRRPI